MSGGQKSYIYISASTAGLHVAVSAESVKSPSVIAVIINTASVSPSIVVAKC